MHIHYHYPRPEPFSPYPPGGQVPDYAKWMKEQLALKQDKLTFDILPVESSLNPVTSGGIYLALAAKASLVNGKVPAEQLPSYVDDVLEFASREAFPNPGESGVLYVARDQNLVYRWTGTDYVAVVSKIDIDTTVTRLSSNPVASLGIWAAIWGSLAATPAGYTSLYDWTYDQLDDKLNKSGGDTMTGGLTIKNASLSLIPQRMNEGTSVVMQGETVDVTTADPVTQTFNHRTLTWPAATGTLTTEERVAAIVNALKNGAFRIVASLPATGEAMVIYLVAKEDSETGDVYDEYIWVDNAWEHIGSTQIDLSDYYNKTETNSLLAAKLDKSGGIVTGNVSISNATFSVFKSDGNIIAVGGWNSEHEAYWLYLRLTGDKWALCHRDASGEDVPGEYVNTLPDASGTLALTAGTGHGGNLAALDANGNPIDSGKKPADFAPATNIPKSALASAVQTSLDKADAALPKGGGTMTGAISFDDNMPAGGPCSVYYNDDQWHIKDHMGNEIVTPKYTGGTVALTASPAFTGTPTAPTPASGDDSTKVATTAFVQDALGGITPGPDNTKLDSVSAAPAFDPTATYPKDYRVTHNGKLYVCTVAVTTPGAWTGDTNWTADTMTDPDATVDITNIGQLRVVAKDGTVLWAQGYDLASTSAVALNDEGVNLFTFGATTATAFSDATAYAVGDRVIYNGAVYKFTEAHAAGAWIGTDATEDPDTQAFALPSTPTGKVGDFILDIDNTANTVVGADISLTGINNTFSIVVPEGEALADILSIGAGEMAELYFTMTAFRVNDKPTWKIVKQVVENGGAQS